MYRGCRWLCCRRSRRCYGYVPLATQSPPPGQLVELQVTDKGRVGLSDRFGPGLEVIAGRVESQQANDLMIDVYRVKHITGESTQWSGESVRLDRGFVGLVKARRVSALRTTAIAVAAGTVLALHRGPGAHGRGERPEGSPRSPRATDQHSNSDRYSNQDDAMTSRGVQDSTAEDCGNEKI